MIEDKELGLKVAENEEEKFWHDLRDRISTSNLNMAREIEVNKVILKFIEKKLKEINK